MGETIHRIAVTGASGYIGSQLIASLERHPEVERILAIDIRPIATEHSRKISFLKHDVTVPLADELAQHGIKTMVHLAYVLRPDRDHSFVSEVNVCGVQNILKACDNCGVERIVYLSSTSIYGAHLNNPSCLTEEMPARPVKGFQYSEDKARVESLLMGEDSATGGVIPTILRVCPVVGPNADNFIARAFLRSILVKVQGADPPLQFIQEEDLIDVMTHCVLSNVSGTYNVAGEGTIFWSEMAGMLGRKLVTLPAPLLYTVTEAAWRLHIQSTSPSSGLDFIRYRWTASTEKIKRDLGVRFRYSSQEAWETFATVHGRQQRR